MIYRPDSDAEKNIRLPEIKMTEYNWEMETVEFIQTEEKTETPQSELSEKAKFQSDKNRM